MIYGCPRTVSVQAVTYCTLARLSYDSYLDLKLSNPDIDEYFMPRIFSYDDKLMRFLRETIQRVPYLQGIGEQALHELMFSLRKSFYDKHHLLQKTGDDASTLLFVLDGVVELYTEFEGTFFLLEKLFRGSAINYRTFFMEYAGKVNMRTGRSTVLLEVDYTDFENLMQKHEVLETQFLKFQKKILTEGNTFPLDYIMYLPAELREIQDEAL